MPPSQENAYTTSPPVLTEEQIITLIESFNSHRSQLSCPNCSAKGHFRRNGTNKNYEIPQPLFRCVNCGRSYFGHIIKELLDRIIASTNKEQTTPMPTDINSLMSTAISTIDETSRSFDNIESQTTQSLMHTLIASIQKLTTELTSALREIDELRNETKILRERLDSQSTVSNNSQYAQSSSFPPLGTNASIHAPQTTSPSPWHQPHQVQQLKASFADARILSQRQQKQTTAARFFQPPSANPGFTYIYLNTKTRIPIGKLRSLFRKLNINNNRILDAHYPDRNIVALLIHNDFEQELRDHLSKLKISFNDTFDPLDPVHLRDPTLQDLPTAEKEHRAFLLHCNRMEKALDFIRAPIKYAVAKHFLSQGWITEETLADIYTNKPSDIPTSTDIFGQEDEDMVLDNELNFETPNLQDPISDSQ